MPNLKWFQRNVTVKLSSIPGGGMGLFAKEDLPKGTRLGWYRGKFMTTKQWNRCKNDKYIWLLLDEDDEEYYIDASELKKNNKLRYVNGCFTPGQYASVNTEAYQKDDKIWYKTIRKIPKGMELLVDYGCDYFTEDDFKKNICGDYLKK